MLRRWSDVVSGYGDWFLWVFMFVRLLHYTILASGSAT